MFISLSLSGSVLACKGQGEVIPARTAQGKENGPRWSLWSGLPLGSDRFFFRWAQLGERTLWDCAT